jgi:hypothetical protein
MRFGRNSNNQTEPETAHTQEPSLEETVIGQLREKLDSPDGYLSLFSPADEDSTITNVSLWTSFAREFLNDIMSPYNRYPIPESVMYCFTHKLFPNTEHHRGTSKALPIINFPALSSVIEAYNSPSWYELHGAILDHCSLLDANIEEVRQALRDADAQEEADRLNAMQDVLSSAASRNTNDQIDGTSIAVIVSLRRNLNLNTKIRQFTPVYGCRTPNNVGQWIAFSVSYLLTAMEPYTDETIPNTVLSCFIDKLFTDPTRPHKRAPIIDCPILRARISNQRNLTWNELDDLIQDYCQEVDHQMKTFFSYGDPPSDREDYDHDDDPTHQDSDDENDPPDNSRKTLATHNTIYELNRLEGVEGGTNLYAQSRHDSQDNTNTVIAEDANSQPNSELEVEYKFKLLTKDTIIMFFLFQRPYETQKFTDIYFDNTNSYWLSASDKWLRKRNDTFTLKVPAPKYSDSGIQGVHGYLEINSNHDILKAINIPYSSKNISTEKMEAILKNNLIIPYARITTNRTSYKKLTLAANTAWKHLMFDEYKQVAEPLHTFEIDIDTAELECLLTGRITGHSLAELEMSAPAIMAPHQAIKDILQRFKLIENRGDPPRAKLIELIFQFNPICYGILKRSGMTDYTSSTVNNYKAEQTKKELPTFKSRVYTKKAEDSLLALIEPDETNRKGKTIGKQIKQMLLSAAQNLAKGLSTLPIPKINSELLMAAINQIVTWHRQGKEMPVLNPNEYSFYTFGSMEVLNGILEMERVLFDTGATHASYISKEFVDKHREVLAPFIFPHDSVTVLGDGSTTCHITECLVVNCCFSDDKGKTYSGSVRFHIYETQGTQFIIGAPDIVTSFRRLVVKMILNAEDEVTSTYKRLHELEQQSPEEFKRTRFLNGLNLLEAKVIPKAFHDIDMPLGTNPFQLSAEDTQLDPDEDAEVPCSFTEPLNYLSIPHAEALETYKKLIETNVAKEFALAKPEIRDL